MHQRKDINKLDNKPITMTIERIFVEPTQYTFKLLAMSNEPDYGRLGRKLYNNLFHDEFMRRYANRTSVGTGGEVETVVEDVDSFPDDEVRLGGFLDQHPDLISNHELNCVINIGVDRNGVELFHGT